MKEAKRLDNENGNILWWDAILKKMVNIRIPFELFHSEGGISLLVIKKLRAT